LKIVPVIAVVVIFPPFTAKFPVKETAPVKFVSPTTFKSVPTYSLFSMPAPPSTINAPVSLLEASVVDKI
jgi:hypothetical protein